MSYSKAKTKISKYCECFIRPSIHPSTTCHMIATFVQIHSYKHHQNLPHLFLSQSQSRLTNGFSPFLILRKKIIYIYIILYFFIFVYSNENYKIISKKYFHFFALFLSKFSRPRCRSLCFYCTCDLIKDTNTWRARLNLRICMHAYPLIFI